MCVSFIKKKKSYGLSCLACKYYRLHLYEKSNTQNMETCRRALNMSSMGAKVNPIRMLNVENLGTKRVGILISIYTYKLYSQSI